MTNLDVNSTTDLEARKMNRLTNILRLLSRAAFLAAMIAAPVLTVPQVNAGDRVTIEAPAQKKMGAGLVLLVSLQRA